MESKIAHNPLEIYLQPKSRRPRRARGKVKGPLTTSRNNPNQLSMVVEPWMPLTPPRLQRTLRYSDHMFMTATSGAVTTQVFAANDCYDPDVTGTGHQPMGFDQMMLFYNHFTVIKSRIIVTFSNSSTTPSAACIRQDAAASPITTISRVIEIGANVMCTLDSSAGFGANKTMELTLDIPRLQGMTSSTIMADTSLRGSSAASPTELSYFHIQIWNAAGVTVASNIDVILEQTAVFSEPRDNGQS